MGEVRFSVNDVVNVRFAVSPLWETVASLRALADPGRHTVHLPWIQAVRRFERDRAFVERMRRWHELMPHPDGVLGFLTPPSNCPLAEIEQELAVVRSTPAERVRADLRGAHSTAAEDLDHVVRDLTDTVYWWWQTAIKAYWSRIRAVLEADIAFRTRQLAEDGIQQLFMNLHPSVRWAGDRLVAHGVPGAEDDIELDGQGLPLTPSVFARTCAFLSGHATAPASAGIIYPARAVGTLWERRSTDGTGLARLLGQSRALLLTYVSSPATTTQLAARTGLSLGAVSQHLTVLRDAGLVTSHRYRREVNYTASDLGVALLDRA